MSDGHYASELQTWIDNDVAARQAPVAEGTRHYDYADLQSGAILEACTADRGPVQLAMAQTVEVEAA